ncbi:hypothetical protein KCU95_g13637, partial [Aureobasidium melanogenum]
MTENMRISVMQDDERPQDPGNPSTSSNMSPSEAFSMMEEISRRRVTRREARKFVKELWLVQYDDEGDDDASDLRKDLEQCPDILQQTYDPETEEASSPTQRRHEQTAAAVRELLGDRYRSVPDPEIEIGRTRACKHCQYIPKFPPGAHKFKIVRSPCEHFLAISYPCPPADMKNPPAATYDYRRQFGDGNSTVWDSSKPPDETMDRAIEFARAADIRQIWVDKACIAQFGAEEAEGALPKEHQLTVQAMDLVYQRAIGCIGLLEGMVTESGWLDALDRFYVSCQRGSPARDDDLSRIVVDLLHFLQHIANDRFNERAWIFQEGISAGEAMTLSMRIEPGVVFPSRLRQTLCVSQVAEGSVLFKFGELQMIARNFESFVDFFHTRGANISTEGLQEVFDKFDMIHPRPLNRNSQILNFHVAGGYNYSSVSKSTAATALTYLRPRNNLYLEDRLAILANMCDYEVRVDIEQVQGYPSLAVAHMAQAIMNGDLSLLIPELTKIDQPDPLWNCVWCPKPSEAVSRVVSRQARAAPTTLDRFGWNHKILKEGLSCPATIWKLQQKVDLTVIRSVWGRQWASWIEEPSHDLRSKTSEICSILFHILSEVQAKGLSSLADSIWISTRRERLVRGESESEWIDAPDTVSEILANTALISSVDELFDLSWVDSKTFREIWIIERVMSQGHLWYGQAQKSQFGKSESEGEDKDRDEDSNDNDKDDHNKNDKNDKNDNEHDVGKSKGKGKGKDKDQDQDEDENNPNDDYDPDETAGDAKAALQKERPGWRSLSMRLLSQKMMTLMFRQTMGDEDEPDSKAQFLSVAAYVWFAIYTSYGLHTPAMQDLRGELGAFDVDGPTMVAIPYDLALETLPRALERSMSVCWMINHDPSSEASMADEDKTDTIKDTTTAGSRVVAHDGNALEPVEEVSRMIRWRVVGKVRGCWPVMEMMPVYPQMFV